MATVTEGASVMSRGDLKHRIPEEGVTEVAAIATSINRMAADLAASRDALVDSEKQAALGALVPAVAHNIRNPLASIRATAQILDETTDRDELRESGEAIIETIDRLERWVNALVSYLHPLQPSFRVKKASQLIDAVQSMLRPKLQEKGIRVERVNWHEDMELKVDPDLMEQALSGLLANAVEASPRNGHIRIIFERAPERFIIRFQDSGPGIPFYPEPRNLEPGPSTKRYGTGLGIPVAFKICQSHGWELKFSRREEGGTEVTITAPLHGRGETSS
ncbi:MAG: ATP-binding protein [Gammaproteobacteria bacterium]